jgi:hypothetical protein
VNLLLVDGALSITCGTAKLKGAVNCWVNGIFGTLDLMGSGRWMGWRLVMLRFWGFSYGNATRSMARWGAEMLAKTKRPELPNVYSRTYLCCLCNVYLILDVAHAKV